MGHLQAMHLKEEVISRSPSWQSSLEAARNEILEKKEKQAIERRKKQRRKELMKVQSMKVPLTVPSKTVTFTPTVSTSKVETMSVASFVSFHGDDCHNISDNKH